MNSGAADRPAGDADRRQAAMAALCRLGLGDAAPDTLLEAAARLAAQALALEFSGIFEPLAGGQALRLRAGCGWPADLLGQVVVPPGAESHLGETLAQGRSVWVRDLAGEPLRHGAPVLCEHGIRSGLSVVIPGPEQPFGVLAAHAKCVRDYGAAEIEFLQAVAQVLAVALRHAQEAERLRGREQRAAGLRMTQYAVDHAGESIFWINADGRFTYANEAACRELGFAREELLELRVPDIDPDFSLQRWRQHWEALPPGQTQTFESHHRRRDGQVLPVEITVSVVEFAGQQFHCVFARDISRRQRTELALRASEARLRTLFESAPIGIHMADATGRYQMVNQAFANLLRRSVDEVLTLRHVEVTHPDDVAATRAGAEALWSGCINSLHLEKRYLAADGTVIWADVDVFAQRDERGRQRSAIGFVRDITQQKRAELALRESEQRFRSIVQALPMGTHLYELEPDNRLVLIDSNPAADALTGIATSRLHGQTIEEAFPGLVGTEIPRRYRDAARHGTYWQAIGLRYDQGEIHGGFDVFAFQTSPGRMGALFHNVSERIQAEDAIRRLNEELEQRVEQRTADLQVANRELEAFAYTVSHDLRAPARHIHGFARILAEDHGPTLSAEAQRLVGVIRGSAERIGALIDDLLAFSRLSRRPLERMGIDMEGLVREVYQEVAAGYGARAVAFELGPLPAAQGDPHLIRQVWRNLLDNAFKYSSARQRPNIKVECVVEGGSTWFRVADNGVGFDMRYADKLFGVFQRLHRQDEFPGTGVGLAIVQRIVQRHGGRVRGRAVADAGATFEFTLGG